MKIILANGTELNPIMATGYPSTVQGANRDTLAFVFRGDADMAALDATFNSAACERITIVEGTEEYTHKGYTVRAELSKKNVEVEPATDETAAVYEERITVAMAQRTYAENQLASLTDTVDALVAKYKEITGNEYS